MARILVTGSARGLGRAITLDLLYRGHHVIASDLNELGLAKLPAQDTLRTVMCDVSDPDSVERTVETARDVWGGLDGIVTAAGLIEVTRKPAHDVSPAEFDRVMAVNVRGTWLLCRAGIPAIADSGGGSIVTYASETAFSGSRNFAHYVASKAAVIGLTRAFAKEAGPLGVRVNAIAPGYTDTEGGRTIGDPDTYDVSATPLGRVAVPDDMTGATAFLLSDDSAFISGQILMINGGRVT